MCRELSMLIAREINDPRIRLVSINSVRVSKDLKHATVYFSSLDTTPKEGEAGASGTVLPNLEKVLNQASGFLRRRLSQHAEMRVTPALRFKYDDSIRRGIEITNLIDQLNQNRRDG